MSFDLCQVKKAEKPYYIESIGIHIYTMNKPETAARLMEILRGIVNPPEKITR